MHRLRAAHLERWRLLLPFVLFLLTIGAGRVPPEAAAGYAGRAEVRAYVKELVQTHGMEQDALLELFASVERQQRALELVARPAERQLLWHEYRALFLNTSRIRAGIDFQQQHQKTLERAAARFGVPARIVVAILGVETRYGAFRGKSPALDSLVTLAFDYPRRAAFFRRELTQYLLLAQEQGFDPRTRLSSYAGAMGYSQFIPSSYRSYAVDFDGDGVADLQNSVADAIGSIANYLAVHGWKKGGGIAVRAVTAPGFDASVAGRNPKLRHSAAELTAHGYQAAELPAKERLAVLRLEGKEGTQYWLGQHNFYVITRYNHSHLYAMAVFHLSEALAAQFDPAGKQL